MGEPDKEFVEKVMQKRIAKLRQEIMDMPGVSQENQYQVMYLVLKELKKNPAIQQTQKDMLKLKDYSDLTPIEKLTPKTFEKEYARALFQYGRLMMARETLAVARVFMLDDKKITKKDFDAAADLRGNVTDYISKCIKRNPKPIIDKNNLEKRLEWLQDFAENFTDEPRVTPLYKYGILRSVILELNENPAIQNFKKLSNQEPEEDMPTVKELVAYMQHQGLEGPDFNNWSDEQFQYFYSRAKARFAFLMWSREIQLKNRKNIEKAGVVPKKVIATISELGGTPAKYMGKVMKKRPME
jgi:hypothetical protein